MAVLGLHFCARAFSSCGERGPLFIAVRGPPTITASLAAEHRLQTRRLSSCGSRAQLLRGMWDLPRRTRVPCVGRQILNHCATREVRTTLLKRPVGPKTPKWSNTATQRLEVSNSHKSCLSFSLEATTHQGGPDTNRFKSILSFTLRKLLCDVSKIQISRFLPIIPLSGNNS